MNGTVIPNHRSSAWPIRPLRPSRNSSASPPTTGGSTSGSNTTERRNGRPGRPPRASTAASGPPSTMHSAVEIAAVSSDSRSASSAESDSRSSGIRAQFARSSSPTTGRLISANAERRGDPEHTRQPDPPCGHGLPRAGHGFAKPACSSAFWPGSPVTMVTNWLARSAAGAFLSTAIG